MATLTIDGRRVEAPAGTFLLQACRQAGVSVPTLCDHPAVEPYGGCRLCVVDVTRPEWDGWQKMVVSCLYPVEDGLIVDTRSDRVIETRRVVLDLLLARSPRTLLIQRLAREYGIERTSYEPNPEPTDCILCGLCVRICDRLGHSAIGTADRGAGRVVAPPFHEPPEACVGCLACAEICPTGFIRFESGPDRRRIWNRDFEMVRCPRCGRAHVTKAQAAWYARRMGWPEAEFEVCDSCRRRDMAATTVRLGEGPTGNAAS